MKNKPMNLNELAAEIAYYEGGKKNLTIAQIKEVLSCLGTVLAHDVDKEDAFLIISKLIRKGKQ